VIPPAFLAYPLCAGRLEEHQRTEVKNMKDERDGAVQMPSTMRSILLDEGRVSEALLEDRRKQDFVGKLLPFTLADDPTCDPVRYFVGDDWLDLLVIYDPSFGWEVHVMEKSSEDVDIGDVYADLRKQLLSDLRGQASSQGESQGPSNTTLREITVRLERLEQRMPKSVEVPAITSPYLNAGEAAAYLRINVNALYSLVERRKLKPLPGHRRYRFTVEILDAYLRGK
jgi:hypothetical protein